MKVGTRLRSEAARTGVRKWLGTMFCNYCGTANPDDASFCNACGRAVNKPAAAVPPTEKMPSQKKAPELPAAANVVAKEDVEAYYLDRATLHSMFELFPHLGSRFYHSLAVILSRRLREQIDPVAPPQERLDLKTKDKIKD